MNSPRGSLDPSVRISKKTSRGNPEVIPEGISEETFAQISEISEGIFKGTPGLLSKGPCEGFPEEIFGGISY